MAEQTKTSQQTATSDNYISAAQLRARYANISPRTEARWVAEGLLPAPVLIGARRFYKLAEVKRRDAERSRLEPTR